MTQHPLLNAVLALGVAMGIAAPALAAPPPLSLIEVKPGPNWTVTINKDFLTGSGKVKIFKERPAIFNNDRYNEDPAAELSAHGSAYTLAPNPKGGPRLYWLAVYPGNLRVDLKLDFTKVGGADGTRTILSVRHWAFEHKTTKPGIIFDNNSPNAECTKSGYGMIFDLNETHTPNIGFLTLNTKP